MSSKPLQPQRTPRVRLRDCKRQASRTCSLSGSVVCSYTRLLQGEDWAAAIEALKEGKIHKMQINSTNKGGIVGQVEGLTGIDVFMPNSKACTVISGKGKKTLGGTIVNVKVVAVSPWLLLSCIRLPTV